jgi:S1-C subfamily serine protease
MCPAPEAARMVLKVEGKMVPNEAHESAIWNQLSKSFSDTIKAFQNSIVAVDGGGRSTSSGLVWRPGVVITTHHGLRQQEGIEILHTGEPISGSLIGSDPATDLAVLRIPSENLTPVENTADRSVRVGEVVLSVGRSRLGDISASSGIIARTGSAWRTWRGGHIDQLIRPDIRLYVGQAGSALVNEHRQVLGINSPALARQAVITIPARTIDRIVDAILERGHAPRPFLGIAMQAVPVPEPVHSLFPADAEHALLVIHVEQKAPAAQAGVMVGDLVLSLNGEPIQDVREFLHRLAGFRIGDTIALVVIRGGAKVDLTVGIGDRG